MLTLLVPILINYLLEDEQLQYATRFQTSLHQQSFQWLNKIGPKYPQVTNKIQNIEKSRHYQFLRIFFIPKQVCISIRAFN